MAQPNLGNIGFPVPETPWMNEDPLAKQSQIWERSASLTAHYCI
jgi:hypothetical protein